MEQVNTLNSLRNEILKNEKILLIRVLPFIQYGRTMSDGPIRKYRTQHVILYMTSVLGCVI